MTATAEKPTRLAHFCSRCEKPLPSLCQACKDHPGSKPRIVEIYGVPEIIRTAECGCCHLMRCQRPGCGKTMWRHLTRRDVEQMPLKNHFHHPQCTRLATAAAKRTAKDVPCACGCGLVCRKHLSAIAVVNRVYYSQKHHYAHRKVLNAERRRAEALANGDDGRLQALTCNGPRCRGEVRDHWRIRAGKMQCTYCSTIRDESVGLGQPGVPA